MRAAENDITKRTAWSKRRKHNGYGPRIEKKKRRKHRSMVGISVCHCNNVNGGTRGSLTVLLVHNSSLNFYLPMTHYQATDLVRARDGSWSFSVFSLFRRHPSNKHNHSSKTSQFSKSLHGTYFVNSASCLGSVRSTPGNPPGGSFFPRRYSE